MFKINSSPNTTVTSEAFKSNVVELCRVLGICPHPNPMVSFEACLKAIKRSLQPESSKSSEKTPTGRNKITAKNEVYNITF